MIPRKSFTFIASSVASMYLISAFFVVSCFSLLWLRYPQQYFNHFHYLNIIKPNPITTTINNPTMALLIDDYTSPSLNPLKEVVQNSIASPPLSPPPLLSNSKLSLSHRVDDFSQENKTVVVQDEKTKETVEDEDESAILSVDHLSDPPTNSTKEERMEWIKKNIPNTKILESTPTTRKFELKINEFVSTNNCNVSIYMTWISTTRFIGKRELFSLETVLKAHPRACLIMVSRIMSSKRGKEIIQPLIDRGYLIFPIAPDFTILLSGTPAQEWLEKLKDGKLDPGTIPITQNLSNLLRLVILYKYGGVYLDTDMIILKDLTVLKNTIGIQEADERSTMWKRVNNAVLIFNQEHPLLLRFMEEFSSTFNGSQWGYNGPDMATRVIKKLLNGTNYQFNLMPTMAFYPVDWDNIHRFYRNPRPNNDTKWAEDMYYNVTHQSFGVHLWNKVSSPLKIEQGSVIGRLISDHCIICTDIYG